MASRTLDVSVIICAYTEKRWDDLVAAVSSVQRQTMPAREIIVVVDHNAALLERARTHISGIIAIPNDGDKGLSAARNSGAALAQGSVVAFLDDDAVAAPQWVERLLACYESPHVLGGGGAIVPLWLSGRPWWFPDEFNWVVGCTYRGLPEETAPVRNVIGANMSIRRDILMRAGGFRPGFGCNHDAGKAGAKLSWLQSHAGDEETEFCIRARRQAPEGVWFYAPGATVHHRVPQARTHIKYFLWRCFDEGLGKAGLAALHGSQDSLASERAYATKTLPRGVVRGVADVCRHGDLTGIGRATAILAGFTSTAVGYVLGRISRSALLTGTRNDSQFQHTDSSVPSH